MKIKSRASALAASFVVALATFAACHVTKGNGVQTEIGSAVVTDGASTYIAGSFAGTMTLGSYTLNSTGVRTWFAAKLNSNGQVQWARAIALPDSQPDDPAAILLSPNKSQLFIAGDSFLVRVQSNGTLVPVIADIDHDSLGAPYNCDHVVDMDRDDAGTLLVACDNAGQSALMRFYPSLTLKDALPSVNDISVKRVHWDALDSSAYLLAEFTGTVPAAPDFPPAVSQGGVDVVLWRIRTDPVGMHASWMQPFGGMYDEEAAGFEIDSQGYSYVAFNVRGPKTKVRGKTYEGVPSGANTWRMAAVVKIRGAAVPWVQLYHSATELRFKDLDYEAGSLAIGATYRTNIFEFGDIWNFVAGGLMESAVLTLNASDGERSYAATTHGLGLSSAQIRRVAAESANQSVVEAVGTFNGSVEFQLGSTGSATLQSTSNSFDLFSWRAVEF